MRRIVSAVETMAAVSLLVIALVTAANVVLRATFVVQIPDWFDGTRLLMSIALFWGIAVTTWHGTHICVDLLWELLGRRGRRVLDLIAGLITAAFLVPTAWMVGGKVLSAGTQVTTDLRLPIVWFTGVAAAGAFAAAGLAVVRFLLDASGRRVPQGYETRSDGS